MKKLSLILLGSAISLALVTGVFAETSKDTTAAKPAKKAVKTETKTEAAKPAVKKAVVNKQQFSGNVTSVDAAANTITVEKKIGKKTETMTFAAGEKVKLADIKKDSKVTVIYTKEGDKASASSVKEVVVKHAAAKKVEKKTESKTSDSSK